MAGTMSIRRDRANALATSFLLTHEGEIVSGAEERLFPFLEEGELPPDLRLTLRLIVRRLQHDFSEVVRTDKAVIDEKADDIKVRLELKKASTEVQKQLVFIRPLLIGLFGEERAKEILPTEGETAQVTETQKLWRQGDHTVERLRNEDRETPEENTTSVQLEAKKLADELEPPVKRMNKARKQLEEERRKLDAKVIEKENAMADFDSDFRGTVRFGVGLCILVGRPKLARKLRTSVLRAPQRGSSATDEASEEASPTQDESPDPTTAESTTAEPAS